MPIHLWGPVLHESDSAFAQQRLYKSRPRRCSPTRSLIKMSNLTSNFFIDLNRIINLVANERVLTMKTNVICA